MRTSALRVLYSSKLEGGGSRLRARVVIVDPLMDLTVHLSGRSVRSSLARRKLGYLRVPTTCDSTDLIGLPAATARTARRGR